MVTGSGSGIGRAIALGLAGQDMQVVGLDRDLAAAERTAADSNGGLIRAVEVDVADAEAVDAVRDEVVAEFGAPTVVVNAAGWDRNAPFLDATPEFAQTVVAINYLGPVNLCRAFLPGMVDAGYGRVVNVASDAGRVGSAGESIYAGAKGGVIALTKSLAREMARHQITVNCVCPGPTDTPLFAAQDESLQVALIKAIPFRRLARPEEVAAAVLFFASDAASFITGQVLSVSGGLTMAG
ncbi:MAG TPA: SDR family NAD(P)-dependent oxidoreductase [Mycobacteriales bacterium]|nr:SDR family NAD(P)-dependent oxidoreductase [Mycobacteriales bacterium]